MVTLNGTFPLTPFNAAVTLVDPDATAVASPELSIVATAGLATVHDAVEVTFAVVLLAYVAVAMNCCVLSKAKLAAFGVTAIEVSAGGALAVTVSAAVPVTPLNAAAIVVDPAATAVASPATLMVAVAVLELVHVAVEVTFAVDASL
jgi:hypothetical protein